MAEAMAMAVIRIEEQGEQFLPYPRPYPALADLGWLWLKEGRYWVAFTSDGDHHVITVVFFDAADIPSRV